MHRNIGIARICGRVSAEPFSRRRGVTHSATKRAAVFCVASEMMKPTLASRMDAMIWNARSLRLSDERARRKATIVAKNHGGAQSSRVTVLLYPRVAASANTSRYQYRAFFSGGKSKTHWGSTR